MSKNTQVIDQLTDTSFHTLFKIAETMLSPKLEEEVRKISIPSLGMDKIASVAFADASNRNFPINSKDNVLLSKIYFDYQKDAMEPKLAQAIDRKLDTYLDLHNIPDSLFEYPEQSIEKTASTQTTISSTYLLPEHNIGKVTTSQDLVKLGTDFEQNHTNLAMSDRVTFSHNFIKCAGKLKITSYPRTISKYASMLDTDVANTAYLLRLRAGLCHKVGADSAQYVKLASMLEKVVDNNGGLSEKSLGLISNQEEFTKLAELIQELDETSGLADSKYDRKIPDSYSAVFNKEAGGDESDPKVTEKKNLTKSEIVSLYGQNVLEEIEDEDGKIDYDKLKEVEKLVKD